MSEKLKIAYCVTSDMTEAAYLLTLPGARLHGCDWADEELGVVKWVVLFDVRKGTTEDELRAARQELRAREASVEPYTFMACLRQVRLELYEFTKAANKQLPTRQQVLSILETNRTEGAVKDETNTEQA